MLLPCQIWIPVVTLHASWYPTCVFVGSMVWPTSADALMSNFENNWGSVQVVLHQRPWKYSCGQNTLAFWFWWSACWITTLDPKNYFKLEMWSIVNLGVVFNSCKCLDHCCWHVWNAPVSWDGNPCFCSHTWNVLVVPSMNFCLVGNTVE